MPEGSVIAEFINIVTELIEVAALAIEVLAVGLIIYVIATASYRFFTDRKVPGEADTRFYRYKERLGKSLLLGLEILVAADIVRTVALEPSFENVGVLGLLVLIRTFLSWSLVVELEGRWPWQSKCPPAADEETAEIEEDHYAN
jgi:uncharacterized membrane protein